MANGGVTITGGNSRDGSQPAARLYFLVILRRKRKRLQEIFMSAGEGGRLLRLHGQHRQDRADISEAQLAVDRDVRLPIIR